MTNMSWTAHPTYFEVIRDSSPLDYSNTRASLVLQHRDQDDGADQELIPGSVFQYNSTGDGWVNAGAEQSGSIWMGAFSFMGKSGDGSAHTFTGIMELHENGSGGYNEGGLFQGEITNLGSSKGTISGVEVNVKDGVSGNSRLTRAYGVASRMTKWTAGNSRPSDNFIATSEGNKDVRSVLTVLPNGSAKWEHGIDLSAANFSSGRAMSFPNNTNLAWKRPDGSLAPSFFLAGDNNLFMVMSTSASKLVFSTTGLASRMEVDNNATDAVLVWINGTLKRLVVGATNSGGTGYRMVRVAN
jgi:hypothetical protein